MVMASLLKGWEWARGGESTEVVWGWAWIGVFWFDRGNTWTGVTPGQGSKLLPPMVVHEYEPASAWRIPPEVHQQDAMLSRKGPAFAFQVWLQTEDD